MTRLAVGGGANEASLDGVAAVLADKPVPALAAKAEALAKARSLALGEFENGPDGFGDAIVVEKTGGKVGKGCAKLVNADKWVSTRKDLSLNGKDIMELSRWVKSL